MAVLALKLSGPLQSWGTSLKLKDHETDSMPSKSGVLGIIAAAFGRKRDESVSDLARLRFGVRTDAPGTLLKDFQTARILSNARTKKVVSYIGHRYYLQDACFVAALEGNRDFLEECMEALKHPIFPPYLGRRSCVPDPGMIIGIYEGSLESVLTDLNLIPNQSREVNGDYMRICVEVKEAGDRMRRDNPVSYDFHNRQYSYRMEREMQIGEKDVYK